MACVPVSSCARMPPRTRCCQPPPATYPPGVHVHHATHLRRPPSHLIHRCRSKPRPFLPLRAPHRSLYPASLALLSRRTTRSSALPAEVAAATAATRATGAASIMHKGSLSCGTLPQAARDHPWPPCALVPLTTMRASSTTAASGPPLVKSPPPQGPHCCTDAPQTRSWPLEPRVRHTAGVLLRPDRTAMEGPCSVDPFHCQPPNWVPHLTVSHLPPPPATSSPAITGIERCCRLGAMEPLSPVSSMGYQPSVVGPGWIGPEGTMALSFSRDFSLNHLNLVQKLLKIARI
jgi:hypothetical protein